MPKLEGHPKEVAEDLAKLDRATQLQIVEQVMGDHSVCRKMLAATGRAPEPARRQEFIVHDDLTMSDASPQLPVLRRISQPIIDTIILPADQPLSKYSAFMQPRTFEDGLPKTSADTNMTQAGALGYPLHYDLRWLELHFEKYERSAARFALGHMYFAFYFGCNVPWLRISGSAWTPLVGCPQHPGDPRYTSPENLARAVADEFKARGDFWPHYWHRIGDPEGSRRIDSTESFRVEIWFDEPIILKDPIRLKVAMQDTLYTNL